MRDGAVLAAVMAGVIVFMVAVLSILSPMLDKEFEFRPGAIAFFTALYAGLGFAMGFIPSTVEAHIGATRLFLDAAARGRDVKAETPATT
jgi:hypothetical protein